MSTFSEDNINSNKIDSNKCNEIEQIIKQSEDIKEIFGITIEPKTVKRNNEFRKAIKYLQHIQSTERKNCNENNLKHHTNKRYIRVDSELKKILNLDYDSVLMEYDGERGPFFDGHSMQKCISHHF